MWRYRTGSGLESRKWALLTKLVVKLDPELHGVADEREQGVVVVHVHQGPLLKTEGHPG